MTVVARIRNELNLKQAELASLVGVAQSTISRWEDPESDASPTHHQLMRLRAAVRDAGKAWSDEWLFATVVAPTERVA